MATGRGMREAGAPQPAHHACGRAGGCGRLFPETFFGGECLAHLVGVSRNPRPLAPARPHRAGRLHVSPGLLLAAGVAGFAGMGQARGAVGVACKTDGARTRRPPHPFPPNPALGLGRRGYRPRPRTAPPGCTGGDDATILGRPRRQPARACWCASGISPWKVIKKKCLLTSRRRV